MGRKQRQDRFFEPETWLDVARGLCRKGFESIRSHGRELAEVLASKGARDPVDMCNALICVTIDSIADWGFQLKWDTVASVKKSDSNQLIEVLPS